MHGPDGSYQVSIEGSFVANALRFPIADCQAVRLYLALTEEVKWFADAFLQLGGLWSAPQDWEVARHILAHGKLRQRVGKKEEALRNFQQVRSHRFHPLSVGRRAPERRSSTAPFWASFSVLRPRSWPVVACLDNSAGRHSVHQVNTKKHSSGVRRRSQT